MIRLLGNLLHLRVALHRHDRWSRSQLLRHQAESLQQLRAHARQHSLFYRRFHGGLFDRPLHELPVLTKSVLMEHFDELLTDPTIRLAELEAHLATLRGRERFLGRYWVNATSGSTGRRGIFPVGPSEFAAIIAGFGRSSLWAGFEPGLILRRRLAVLASSVPWHMSFRIMATFRSPWIPLLSLDAAEPIDALVSSLNDWQPQMLSGYPSALRTLAREQAAGHLHIRPRMLFTGGEVLSQATRQLAFEAWEKPIFDQYGTTEAGNIAAECEVHRGLHVNEDLLIVEAVDEHYRPVPAGTFGDKLLVTVLFSRTLPLIRYELSDRVKLANFPCRCGRPYRLIESIEGRAEEMLTFPGRRGTPVAIHPLVFERLLDAVPAAEWQLIQDSDRLTVLLGGGKPSLDSEALSRSIEAEIAHRGAIAPRIDVQSIPHIPRGTTGKAAITRRAPSS